MYCGCWSQWQYHSSQQRNQAFQNQSTESTATSSGPVPRLIFYDIHRILLWDPLSNSHHGSSCRASATLMTPSSLHHSRKCTGTSRLHMADLSSRQNLSKRQKVNAASWLMTALYSRLLNLCEKWIRTTIWRNILPNLGEAIELLAFPFQFIQLIHTSRTLRRLEGKVPGLIGHLLCKLKHFTVMLSIDGGVFRLV